MDVTEIHVWRFDAKEIITPKDGEHFIFPIADGTVTLSGGDHGIRKSTSMRDQPARGEEPMVIFEEESDGSQPVDEMMDDREACNDFWSIVGN